MPARAGDPSEGNGKHTDSLLSADLAPSFSQTIRKATPRTATAESRKACCRHAAWFRITPCRHGTVVKKAGLAIRWRSPGLFLPAEGAGGTRLRGRGRCRREAH